MIVEKDVTILNPVGLHARPASLLVQKANQFKSDINLRNGDRNANAKSILGVLGLGAEQGCVIAVVADGDDAEEAVEGLAYLIQNVLTEVDQGVE